jgi:hypothetical protein
MRKIFTFLIICSFAVGCVDDFKFRIEDKINAVVIEAFISNKSFNDTRNYPSDGRYFQVKLSYTSDVINVRSQPIENAVVSLEVDNTDPFFYHEINPGQYFLLNETFKADDERLYRLNIKFDNKTYVSAWEKLPSNQPPQMDAIDFQETTKPIETGFENGVRAIIHLPVHAEKNIYYKWNYAPTWIHTATMADPSNPNRTCWINNNYYLDDYDIFADEYGGVSHALFYVKTNDNEVVLDNLSILINQQSMTSDYFYFYQEMKLLNERNGLFDNPPFNLKSNFKNDTNDEEIVIGYFGVVNEQAKRLYFNVKDLSYFIPDEREYYCRSCRGIGCPPPPCYDCMKYEFGEPTNIKPIWWED